MAAVTTSSHARRSGCDDASLPPDQRWNGATSVATPELNRFYELGEKMTAAYASSNPTSAQPLAEEYLRAADHFPCNWNYGNAIHNANSILGLLALSDRRKSEAVRYLRAAGVTPGSPQLDTFGPSLLLASRLANAGEYKEVAAYLVSVRRFWKAKDMSPVGLLIPYLQDPDPIAFWINELNSGRSPDFGAPFNSNPP